MFWPTWQKTISHYHIFGVCGFLLGFLGRLVDGQSGCEQAGWIMWPEGASCYYKSPSGWPNKTRDDASATCMSMGGQLTSIVDNFEWQFIRYNVIGSDLMEEFWIGLRKATAVLVPHSGSVDRINWQWMDQVSYSTTWHNWFEGDNDEPSGEAPCVRLFKNGFWGDTFCDGQFRYICKIRVPGGFTRGGTTTSTSTTTTTTSPTARRTTTFMVFPSKKTPAPTVSTTTVHITTVTPKTSQLVSKLVSNNPATSTIHSSKRTTVKHSVIPIVSVDTPKLSVVPATRTMATTTTTKPTTRKRVTTRRNPIVYPSSVVTLRTPPPSQVPRYTTTKGINTVLASQEGLDLPVIIGIVAGAVVIMAITIGVGAFLLWRRRRKNPDEVASSLGVETGDFNQAFYVEDRPSKDIGTLATWPEEDEESVARDQSEMSTSRVSGINPLKSRESEYYNTSPGDQIPLTGHTAVYASVSKSHAI